MNVLKWPGYPLPHRVLLENARGKDAARSLAGRLEVPAAGCRTFVVTSPRVLRLWREEFFDPLRREIDVSLVLAADGEKHKTLDDFSKLFEKLTALKMDRRDLLVAVGGGVLTDVAGFAAATYKRGIRWVCVPTTLIGQVDAGLGGKTGIDIQNAKNMMGAFWSPIEVFLAPAFLRTLPPREIRSGLSEAVKTGEALQPRILRMLEKASARDLDPHSGFLAGLVTECARRKMAVVAGDPLDRGRRAVLNLGHTVGHAVEAAGDFRKWSHGEAVAVGLSVINRFSLNRGMMSREEEQRVHRLIQKLGLLPKSVPEPHEIRPILENDKKKRGSQILVVVPGPLGTVKEVLVRPEELLREEHWTWR